MRQEIRSSPQCQALSPQLTAMLFQKTRKHKKIEPWVVSSKKSDNTQNRCKKNKVAVAGFRAKFWQSTRRRIADRAKLYSLARRRFLDRVKFRQFCAKSYRARVKKQDSCGDSRAEESSRAAHRESSRKDSEALCESKQSHAKLWQDHTDCTDSELKKI